MHFDILTLFPDIIYDYCENSILGRAQSDGLIKVAAHNFRDWSLDKQRHVDDRPYGGGPGMVLQVEPIYRCLLAIGAFKARGSHAVIPAKAGIQGENIDFSRRLSRRGQGGNDRMKIAVMDPRGKRFDQRMAEKFSKLDRLVLICGRYEGFDERIYKFADARVSAGDYILSGGELPALAIVEATARLIPGVLGNPESLDAAAEPPQYTRPEDFMGLKVPSVLLSGDHEKIKKWRKGLC